MPHFMIVLILCINLLKFFLDNKMSVFEGYGAFNKKGWASDVYHINIQCKKVKIIVALF